MTACPAKAGRPRFDIGEIVRNHRAALEAQHRLSREQRRVLTNIAQCRTAALGGHLDVCAKCAWERPAYNSCRDRHCPKCQALAQEEWIAQRRKQMLDVGHFHIVFTLPAELRKLARFAPKIIYSALFSAAAETLRDLADKKMGATLGTTMVLHTWTRDLRFHPHVHAIVTAGGLAHATGTWTARPTYLFPVGAMGTLLRGKMMAALRRHHAEGSFHGFEDFGDPQGFDALMARLAKKKRWNVYAKAPFRKSQHVLEYLGRYTHRVGIANSRLVAVSADSVAFRTKGGAVAILTPVEFLRRLVQHVLPGGFHKIRHYGLYASGASDKLDLAHTLIGTVTLRTTPQSFTERLLALTGRDVSTCPNCGIPLRRCPLPSPPARAPPLRSAA